MVPGMTDDFAALLERGRTGDKRAVARLISLIEQGGETARSVLTQLWPHTGRARIFGITGPPGAGKSTLTNALTKCWRAKGLRVGIIAVDPTSPFTGGAILGDRVRMVRRRRIKHFIQKSAPFSNRPFFHLYVKERERMPWRNLNAIFIRK